MVDAVLAEPRSEAGVRILVEYLMPVIQSMSLRMLHFSRGGARRETALDVCQEVLSELFDADCAVLRRWDPGRGSLAGYTTGVTRNKVLDWLKDERPVVTEVEVGSTDAPAPVDQKVIEVDFARRVLARLSELISPADCLLIEELVVRDRPAKEVAEQLGISTNALFVRRHRLLRLAREVARELGGQHEGA